MNRYVLIDNISGFIAGDTATLPQEHIASLNIRNSELTPTQTAKWLDESTSKEFGNKYTEKPRPTPGETGYQVFRVAEDSSLRNLSPGDFQNPNAIQQVQEDCEYVCFVSTKSPSSE